ncbi:MAG: glycosyltransferase family 9 protein [Candidatus Hydrogenedentes bacterium]|nr:glycosyltransferase family 9 protein [Candidatus Hydrogenedentota bacterium]
MKVPLQLQNTILRSAAAMLRHLPGGRRSATPARILVIRLGNLGDIIVALPAFQALRKQFPGAHLTLLTSPTKRGAPGAIEVLEHDPTFDEMIVYYEDESARPAFLRDLRNRFRASQFDLAVILPDDRTPFKSLLKYLALAASAGIRHTTGARLVAVEEHDMGQAPRIMRLLEPLGAHQIGPMPWIALSPEVESKARRLLAAAAGSPVIGMQCGAKRPANRWLPDRFIETGRHIVQRYGHWVVLTGSPGERELTARMKAGIGDRCIDLAGETTIAELAAVARNCAAFVSNDTGTMHVAAAMGTPVVAIFSARDHKHRWYPYGLQHRVLREDIECSPCLADVCPKYPVPECLNRIGAARVMAALDDILQNEVR